MKLLHAEKKEEKKNRKEEGIGALEQPPQLAALQLNVSIRYRKLDFFL